ncbi:MAG: TetR/AcrR family transcriptional regulator [Lachnospiraceae bacterium]|nr:TetR/AcrR family transcriptional regulator [Lachnospiraceae bacterium]
MGKNHDKDITTKQMLAACAGDLFRKKGFDNVGVRDIAAAAGVTTGSYYHHFKNKMDIINEIYSRSDNYLGNILRELAANNPKLTDLTGFFTKTMVPLVEKDGKDFTIHRMFGMKRHSTEDNELYKEMIGIVEILQKDGFLSHEFTAREINRHLWLVFRGVLYEWVITDDTGSTLGDIMERHIPVAIRAYSV